MSEKTTWVELGRKEGETDEEWGATCKDMARTLAKAWGMEHLLSEAGDDRGDEA